MANEERLIVKPYNPARERQRLLFAIGLMLVCLFAGLLLGGQWFESEMIAKRDLQDEFDKLEERHELLQQRFATAELATEVDRSALETVRKELSQLRGQLADTEEELSFYRNLLQQEGVTTGLMISGFTVTRAEQELNYRLVVQQRTRRFKTIQVKAKVTLQGTSDGEAVQLALSELDPEQESDPLAMKFRYFYVHDGTLRLPEGIEPTSVTVKVWQSGQAKKAIERQFDWLIEAD